MKIFSIKDRAAEFFHQPFFQHNGATAIRMIKNELADTNSQLARTPTDFELWQLGEFSDQTGQISYEPQRIARIEDLREPAPGLPADLKSTADY